MNCEICGAKSISGRCWRHKPKIPLKKSPLKKISKKGKVKMEEKKELLDKQWDFFMEIWDERPHICQSCRKQVRSRCLFVSVRSSFRKKYTS